MADNKKPTLKPTPEKPWIYDAYRERSVPGESAIERPNPLVNLYSLQRLPTPKPQPKQDVVIDYNKPAAEYMQEAAERIGQASSDREAVLEEQAESLHRLTLALRGDVLSKNTQSFEAIRTRAKAIRLLGDFFKMLTPPDRYAAIVGGIPGFKEGSYNAEIALVKNSFTSERFGAHLEQIAPQLTDTPALTSTPPSPTPPTPSSPS